MSKRFEVKDVYVSKAAVLEDCEIHKLLIFDVKCYLEQIQDLRSVGTSHEELASMFAETMKEAFLKYCSMDILAIEDKCEKFKIEFTPEKKPENKFEWLKLNA